MQTNESEHNDTESGSAAGRYAELQKMVAAMAPDFEKFYRDGNKAAGTRVRNAMQQLKTFAQEVRNEVSSMKNEGAAKKED
jgi:N-acetylglucosamine kinase-like BadF-type ATPase